MADDFLGHVQKRIRAAVMSKKTVRKLSFVSIAQRQFNWCWAALTESVSKYFDPASAWTQEGLATRVFKCDCSGSNGSSEHCDQPLQFHVALKLVHRFARMDTLYPRFPEIEKAINADRPLCAQIAWNAGGSHVVAITGYVVGVDGRRYVQVQDTYYGETDMPYDDFLANYVSGGRWTNTFYLKSGT